MKRIVLLFFLSINVLGFSQQKDNLKLGFFGTLQADIGFDLASLIRNSNKSNDYYSKEHQLPTYFTYGFTGQVGYQPLNWFALAAGARYSFISPKFHNVYWMLQPYFFISNPADEEFGFFTISYGTQLNTTQGLSDNGFMGLGVGGFNLIDKHLAQKVQLNVDVHMADEAIWFLGFSYGITVFSNKDL